MAKFRTMKKIRRGFRKVKNEKTRKERRKTGLLTPRKIRKSGKTCSKKEKKKHLFQAASRGHVRRLNP